jgi:hypothetical protein
VVSVYGNRRRGKREQHVRLDETIGRAVEGALPVVAAAALVLSVVLTVLLNAAIH